MTWLSQNYNYISGALFTVSTVMIVSGAILERTVLFVGVGLLAFTMMFIASGMISQ